MPIRPAERKDMPAVAAIHKAQFGTHFLGQYSTVFLLVSAEYKGRQFEQEKAEIAEIVDAASRRVTQTGNGDLFSDRIKLIFLARL